MLRHRRVIPALLVVLTAWRGNNVGCMATADLYEDIAKDRSRAIPSPSDVWTPS